jgi:hypothetical protein
MFRKSRNGWIAAAVIVALLGLPLGSAEADGGQIPAAADLWSQLLGWLEVLWVEEGPEIDPNGRPQATTGDAGSGIDPDGRTTANDDEGSSIDPNGRPHATTNGDAGSSIDPFG